MTSLGLPARIFYDSTIDHNERLRRLEAALAASDDEDERVNLRQYIGDTHQKLELGFERWATPESPEDARDDVMRMAIETAAQRVRRHQTRTSFLEQLLEEAMIGAWNFCSTGGSAAARVALAVPGWDPEPGGTDLVLGLLGDPQPTIVAELKVLDVDETLWDLAKLLSIVEQDATIVRAYLIVATTPKRWRGAEVADLYAPPGPEARDGVREWETRRLFETWKRSWKYLLEGGRARPRDVPGGVRTRFLGAHPVPTFPEYELRCIAVESIADAPRLRFGEDGWPAPSGPSGNTYTLRQLVLAHRAAARWAHAHPDLRDYHRGRADALGRAFGVDLSEPTPATDRGLTMLRQATEAQLDRVRSPFASFLEAPETVSAIYREHGPQLTMAVEALHDRLLDLLVDLTADIWHVAPDATVSEDAVRASGFDPSTPEPDPIDYL